MKGELAGSKACRPRTMKSSPRQPDNIILLASLETSSELSHLSREVTGGVFHQVAASPSRWLSAQELLDQVRQRLSPEERQIMEMRDQGSDWESVAKEMGGTPEALRKRLARASERVARALQI